MTSSRLPETTATELGEVLGYEIQQKFAGSRQAFGEFKDAGIAGCENAHRRIEQQRQRAIERADHQRDAIRFSKDFGGVPAGRKSLRHCGVHGLHPLFQSRSGGDRNSERCLYFEDLFLNGSLEVTDIAAWSC